MRSDWMSCDGAGGLGNSSASLVKEASRPTLQPSRRGFLVGLGLTSLAWAMPRTALSQIAVGGKEHGRNVVVSIFLRGGADGLNIVTPYQEDAYHRERPTLRLLRPNGASKADCVLDLDGFFGFNPALSDLLPLYRQGELAVVHAIGSGDQTRSHFEAMNTMERGLAAGSAGQSSGWLARHLLATNPAKPSPLRAVAFGGTMPDSLRGATDAIALNSLEDFRLESGADAETRKSLREMYALGGDEMSHAGMETLDVLEALNRINPRDYRPSNGATYPDSDLGRALRQVALLLRTDVGLELAVLDKGGWDTHVAQGVSTGLLSGLLQDLGASLAAFARDLGKEMSRVTVVVQTEFGRRVGENSGLGTDHGRASVMFLLGGGVKGGKVYGKWPGLEPHQLEEPGDLRVTTDYRTVLSEVLSKRLSSDPSRVFDNFRSPALGVLA